MTIFYATATVVAVFFILLKYREHSKTMRIIGPVLSSGTCRSVSFGLRVQHYFRRYYNVQYTTDGVNWENIQFFYESEEKMSDFIGIASDMEKFAEQFKSMQDVELFHAKQKERLATYYTMKHPYDTKVII